jgi:hypothetical protein
VDRLAAGVEWLHGYGLAAPVVQLLLATLFGLVFAERWQRWRQRRDFQYRTLVKFSDLSSEMMDRTAELLATRGRVAPDVYEEKRREMVLRWTVFASMRSEVLASYGRQLLLSENYQEKHARQKRDLDGKNLDGKEIRETTRILGVYPQMVAFELP